MVDATDVRVSLRPARSIIPPVLGMGAGAITALTGIFMALYGPDPCVIRPCPTIDPQPLVVGAITLIVAGVIITAVSSASMGMTRHVIERVEPNHANGSTTAPSVLPVTQAHRTSSPPAPVPAEAPAREPRDEPRELRTP